MAGGQVTRAGAGPGGHRQLPRAPEAAPGDQDGAAAPNGWGVGLLGGLGGFAPHRAPALDVVLGQKAVRGAAAPVHGGRLPPNPQPLKVGSRPEASTPVP